MIRISICILFLLSALVSNGSATVGTTTVNLPGIVVAAYRMKQQGWSLADAEAEMQAFGFNEVWVNFKKFIRQYGVQVRQGMYP